MTLTHVIGELTPQAFPELIAHIRTKYNIPNTGPDADKDLLVAALHGPTPNTSAQESATTC